MILEWQRINPGHYMTCEPWEDRFEIIRTPNGWELSDRWTSNVTTSRTLKAAKAVADAS